MTTNKIIKNVKTRFAPSPTGDLHIGSLRTALFSYLFAKKNNGQFFLRIEDTDRTRYKEGSVESIIEGLKWAGLNYDGEIIYQSKRTAIYQKHADELVKAGYAYYCFCTTEDLEKMRTEQTSDGGTVTRYDRRCLKLSKEEVEAKLKSKTPYVIRLNVGAIHELPLQQNVVGSSLLTGTKMQNGSNQEIGANTSGIISFTDLIRGQVEFNLKDIDDQVLLKSDGFPTYHLANVVDDHEMEITHVIRAEEWLPSTPKHIILYQMFGWQIPEFAHLSMILAPDKSKLSKRHGATSVLEFKNLGYLPESVVNYIALLGWNPGTEQEIFSLKKLEQVFDLDKVNKAGAIFDINKLDWLNGYYIRQMDLDKLTELCLPYISSVIPAPDRSRGQAPAGIPGNHGILAFARMTKEKEYVKKVVALEQERLKKLSEIGERTKYFFERPEIDPKMLVWRKSNLADAKEKLQFLITELQKVPDENWTRNALEQFIKGLIEAEKFDVGAVLWPMRVALSGQEKSPSPFEIAEVLGKEETIERLKAAIEKI